MKPAVTEKLVASLLGVEREEDATALFPSVLGNQDGEGGGIYDCERTNRYQRLPTLCFHGNTKQKRLELINQPPHSSPVIRSFDFLLRNMGTLQIEVL